MRKAASEDVTQASGELGFRSACKNGCYDRRLAVHHEPYWDKRQHSRFRCMRAPCSCCGRWYLLRTPQSAGSAHNGRLIASARDNVSLHSRFLCLYFRVPAGGMTAVRSFASVTVCAGYLHTFPQISKKELTGN